MCMCKKHVCLITVILLVSVVGNALADTDWNNVGGDRDWDNVSNWDFGVPDSADKVGIRASIVGPIIDTGTTAVTGKVVCGDWGNTDAIDITDGSLATNGWFILGYGASDDGTFNVSGGTTTVSTHMDVGYKGAGHINMTSGTVTVNGTFGISMNIEGNASSGDVHLDGGTISCASISIQTGGSMDITGGTLIVDGDVTGMINIYKGDGRMTAHDGTWWVICDYGVTTAGKTTVTASDTAPPEPPAPAFPPGDFDDDYDVDIDDVKLLADFWVSQGFPGDFDVNDDGSIDGVEFAQIAEYWRHKSKNVVFIVIDDYNITVESYGHPVVQTPNIDSLATRGVRFENALCNYAVCNPSRSSFLSGLRPDSTGIFGNSGVENQYADILGHRVSLPRLFRNNGYYTKNLGKIFHTTNPHDQDTQAWDEINDYGATGLGQTGTGRNLTDGVLGWCRWLAANGDDEDQGDGIIAREAVEFIGQTHDKPFFLAVGFHKPHDPFHAPASYFDMYPLGDCDPPVVPASWQPYGTGCYLNIPCASAAPFNAFDDNDKREFLRAYYACTTFVDAQVGKVIQALDDNGMTDDTIIILFGDHGYHLGEHRHWNKVTVFEKCHRAPFVVLAPDSLAPAGSVTNEIIEFVDIYPTLAEMCRLKDVPSDLEGISFQPLLDDPDKPWKEAGFIQVRRGGSDPKMGRAVHVGQWRYVEWERLSTQVVEEVELYDTDADPTEYVNLAGNPAYADITLYLQELLHNGQNRLRVPAVDLIGGTFVHLKLDETAGAVAADDSANDFDGALINMDDSDWVAGVDGNALDFDGVNDHVAVDGMCAAMAGNDVTVSAWVKAPAVNTAHQFIISINTASGDNKLLCGTQANSDTLSMYESGWHDTATMVIDNTWHHIAYVIEDSSDTITIYVDGSDVLSFTLTVPISTTDVFSLGQEYDAGMATGDFYSGLLDDVRVYDRALSPAEIAILAQ